MDASAVAQGLDLSADLSGLLRASTSAAHDAVQRGAIVNLLITGQIPQDLHVRYLMMLQLVYERMELALSTHRDHPTLSPSYNPALLARSGPLDDDIAHFTGTRDWRDLPSARLIRQRGHCPELDDYLDRIDQLSDPAIERLASGTERPSVYQPPRARPGLLLAHAYVRYMGDLSGGQFIRAAVMSAYGLERDGIRFYDFGTLEEQDSADMLATMSELKRIKHWFRTAIDAAGQSMSQDEKAEMMVEANYVFELNVNLFSSFDKLATQHTAQVSPLRHVLLPASESSDSSAASSPGASIERIDPLTFIEPTTRTRTRYTPANLISALSIVVVALAWIASRALRTTLAAKVAV